MKFLSLLISFFAVSAQADVYYCNLQNVPAVKTALQQALNEVEAEQMDVKVTGEVTQFTVNAMGDAFDYWGSDVLVYKLDGLAKDNAVAVGVKVSYNSLMAAEYVGAGDSEEKFVCADTGEVNPELIYIDGEQANEESIQAEVVKF